MTPQERQLIDDLFDRLANLETAPRDPEAAAAIAQGQRRAPNAVYALVQTVLVQDEALRRAHERIQALESNAASEANPSGSFLDSMRGTVSGQGQSRGSVPPVNPPTPPSRPAWNTGQVLGSTPAEPYPPQYPPQPQPAGGGGGSFLGTAAAAAAGMVGGSLLLGSIRSMMGGGHPAFGNSGLFGGGQSASPWGSDPSGGSLARDAGLNDVGGAGRTSDTQPFDQAQADADQDQDQDQDDDDQDAMDQDAMDQDDSDDFDGDDDSDYA
jgi:hypothetical protein